MQIKPKIVNALKAEDMKNVAKDTKNVVEDEDFTLIAGYSVITMSVAAYENKIEIVLMETTVVFRTEDHRHGEETS